MSSEHSFRSGPNDIADALRSAIADGVYPPGQRLAQEELADRYGVSRIPLREAIRTLIGENLLRGAPGQGTFVAELDLAEIDEIYALRRQMEPDFAEHMVRRVSLADLSVLRETLWAMDGADEFKPSASSRTDLSFHLDMYRLAGLPVRYGVVSRLCRQLQPYARLCTRGGHGSDRVRREHDAMVAALAAGDGDQLAHQIRTHIDGAQQDLHRAWPVGHTLHAANT